MKENWEKQRSSLIKKTLSKLPFSPGVYFFRDQKGQLLYIGKAASLKDRVGSYFQNINNQNRPIEWVLDKVLKIEYQMTESVLEAYVLEQSLIKKHQPPYNILGKDDKSFCYVIFTQEKFSRILIVRETDKHRFMQKKDGEVRAKRIIGPFVSRKILEEVLRILRKIFPYHSLDQPSEKKCFDFQIGLCPGPYAGKIGVREYAKNINAIKAVLLGRKNIWLKKEERQMRKLAQEKRFEEAAVLRNKILALKRLKDISLLKEDEKEVVFEERNKKRIEGYDISSLAGQLFVGSMVVFQGDQGIFIPDKKQYRRFRIKNKLIQDDFSAMREVLERRFSRQDWPLPDLILIDGGEEHLKLAKNVLGKNIEKIGLLAVAKGPTRKKIDLRHSGPQICLDEKAIRQIRDEAHRFAITYHRKIRKNNFLTGA